MGIRNKSLHKKLTLLQTGHSFLSLPYLPPMGYPSKTLLPSRSCSHLISSKVSLPMSQLLTLPGHSSPSAGAESTFKRSMLLLACYYRNVKSSSLQLQDKAFLHCFGGKGNRKDPQSQRTVPSVYTCIFRPKVRDHHQSAFTAASRADSCAPVPTPTR